MYLDKECCEARGSYTNLFKLFNSNLFSDSCDPWLAWETLRFIWPPSCLTNEPKHCWVSGLCEGGHAPVLGAEHDRDSGQQRCPPPTLPLHHTRDGSALVGEWSNLSDTVASISYIYLGKLRKKFKNESILHQTTGEAGPQIHGTILLRSRDEFKKSKQFEIYVSRHSRCFQRVSTSTNHYPALTRIEPGPPLKGISTTSRSVWKFSNITLK